ncbi:MAG: ribose-phosphate pyrophosphokinase [Burkholderiales bacterium]
MICAFPGNEAFAARLRESLDAAALELQWRRFPDGESYLRFLGECAGRSVALVCTLNTPDSKALALLFAARTARELGAARVGLVAPYLAYMRQDRRFRDGEAITSVHFAALLSQAFDWLVTVDPHLHRRGSLAEIYRIPGTAVAAAPALAHWITEHVPRPLIVGPDGESEQWAAEVAAACGAPHAVMTKTRLGDRRVEIQAPPLGQWQEHTPVLLDDIISSARTMALAALRIREAGLAPPVCVGVHGIFSADALGALRDAGVARVVTTNTIAHETNAIDVSGLIAEALEDMKP